MSAGRGVRAVLLLLGLTVPVSAATYHFDKVGAAQTVCGSTQATTITTTTVSGTQVTLSNNIGGAGDYHFSMDAAGFDPTAGQEMYTPAFGACSTIAANATVALWARASWSGTRPQWQIRLYDVDSSVACGTGTLIGQSAWTNNAGASGTYATTNLTVANSAYSIPAGHRVRIEVWFRAIDANTTNARVRYGLTTTDSYLTTAESACATTTVGNGTDPANAALCPSGATTDLDAFTLQTSTGNDTVTGATVSFGAGTSTGIGTVAVTNDAGATTYGSANNPADTQAVAFGTNIAANTTLTQYKVRVTPKTHAAMPAPPGASYAVTGTVTAITSSNPKTYNDTASATVTIDNLSTAEAVWGAVMPGDTQVTLNWANPGDADFNQVVILRNTASIADTPTEGTTYAQGNTIGTSVVRYVGSLATFTDTGLTNGTGYFYKIFARDTCGNYSVGSETGPHTPSVPVPPVTPGVPSASVDACNQITLSAPYTGDTDADSATTFRRGPAAGGPWTDVCASVAGASPRSCVDNGVTASTTYYYQVDFTDPDGVSGTDPQVIGPYTTPTCTVNPTTAGTASAVVSGCSQISVTAPFTGDEDADGSVLAEYNTTNTWPGTTACASVTGPSPRMCLVTGLAASTTYYVRVTYSDPDGVSGTAVQVLPGTYTTTACGGNGAPPMVMFLAPSRNAVVGGTDRFKVQVYDPDGVATANVLWGLDGAAPASPVTKSTTYNCNIGSQTTCGVYEFDVNTPALVNGSHYVTLRATDSGTPAAVGQRSWAFVVNNSGTTPRGSGYLLRRTHGSQLCTDCHNLPAHSSQATSFNYGSWAQECMSCHTPHATTNIFLIRPAVETPSSGSKGVDFRNTLGKADYSFATATTPGNGVCEVCHTKTKNSDGSPRYRNTGGSDGGKHYDSSCIACHPHGKGFAASESEGSFTCSGCHPTIWQGMTGAVAKTTKHALGNVVGTNDAFTDTTLTWASPLSANAAASRSCVNMCHNDHPHTLTSPVTATHENNVYMDATSQASRAAAARTNADKDKTDFEAAQANGGMCVSCHRNPVSAGRPTIDAAGFGASAHNYTTFGGYGAWSYTLHDGSGFNRNCTKCHADRGDARPGDNTSPFGAVHFSDYPSLLAGSKNPAGTPASFVCYNCHGNGTTGADYSGKDIATQIAKTRSHPANTDSVHDSLNEYNNSAFGAGLGAGVARHASCLDCHEPHKAKPGGHSYTTGTAAFTNGSATVTGVGTSWTSFYVGAQIKPNAQANWFTVLAVNSATQLTLAGNFNGTTVTNAAYTLVRLTNLAGPALEAAFGAQLSTNPAFWTAPATGNFTKKVIVSGTDLEPTLCFKCHSAYYGTLPTSPSGGFAETDQAREFNPNNVGNFAGTWASGETAGGFHPVLASAGSNLGAIYPANLVTTNFPWSTTARNLMTCTDCHESDTATDPNGPHGSAANFILRGPNTTWNGTVTNNGSIPAGTFCLNCHNSTFANSRYPAHTRNDHYVACWNCHAAVPHGGPRPGMLVAPAGAAAGVGGTIAGWDTTAPYWGLASSTNKLYIASYPANNTTNWDQPNCGCNGTGH